MKRKAGKPGDIPLYVRNTRTPPRPGYDRGMEIARGAIIAVPIPWESSPSGCTTWQFVEWTLPDANGDCLPVLADADGDECAWGDDYAIDDPQTGDWVFPDGDRCRNEDLAAAFARRDNE